MDPAPPLSQLRRLGRVLLVFALFLLAGGAITATNHLRIILYHTRSRSSDGANLSQVGRARIICEEDNHDELPPEALTDLYAFAAYLARHSALGDTNFWFTESPENDPALGPGYDRDGPIILPQPDNQAGQINPKFQNAPLAWAVALVPSAVKLPPETPILWTRGLQTDGTWRKDSPYGGAYGWVFFPGGQIEVYSGSIAGHFFKWGTKEPTCNIAEALPPGTRISEYMPTQEDLQRAQTLTQGATSRAQLLFASGIIALLLTLAGSFVVANPKIGRIKRSLCIVACLGFAAWFWHALPN